MPPCVLEAGDTTAEACKGTDGRTREAVLSACWAEALATACRLRAGSLAVRDGVKSRCPPSLPLAAAPFAACCHQMQERQGSCFGPRSAGN